MSDKWLKQHYQFESADLQANREGRLSPKQQQRLLREAKESSTIGCGLVFFGIAFVFPLIWVPIALSVRNDILTVLAISAGVLVWVAGWGSAAWRLVRSSFARPDLTLCKVEGRVELVGVQHRSADEDQAPHTEYELRIGDYAFDVEPELVRHVLSGDVYVVYFLEKTEQILSLERLL